MKPSGSWVPASGVSVSVPGVAVAVLASVPASTSGMATFSTWQSTPGTRKHDIWTLQLRFARLYPSPRRRSPDGHKGLLDPAYGFAFRSRACRHRPDGRSFVG